MIWLVAGAVGCAAIAALLLLLARRNSASSRAPRPRRADVTGPARAAPTSPWAAVSIKPGSRACAAALARSNVRYLERSRPPLPLEGCDFTSCQCSYEHHSDRRRGSGEDRRLGVGLQSELYGSNGEPERRTRGRRATDIS